MRLSVFRKISRSSLAPTGLYFELNLSKRWKVCLPWQIQEPQTNHSQRKYAGEGCYIAPSVAFPLPHAHPESPQWDRRGPYPGCRKPPGASASSRPLPTQPGQSHGCRSSEWRSRGASGTCRQLRECACPPGRTTGLEHTSWCVTSWAHSKCAMRQCAHWLNVLYKSIFL